jgi:hypothetical protein
MDPFTTFPVFSLLCSFFFYINQLDKNQKNWKLPMDEDQLYYTTYPPICTFGHRDQCECHHWIDTAYDAACDELFFPPDATQPPFDATPYHSQFGAPSPLSQSDTTATRLSSHSELRNALTPFPSQESSSTLSACSAPVPSLVSDVNMSDGTTMARTIDFYKKAAGEHRDYAIIKAALRSFYHDEMNGGDFFQSITVDSIRIYLLQAERSICNNGKILRGLSKYFFYTISDTNTHL